MAKLSAEVLFPAAPNWYLGNCMDSSSQGTVAVATNHTLTLLDASTRRTSALFTLPARVTGVGLSSKHVCACTAERGVHCFDLEEGTATGMHKDHQGEPQALVILQDLCITGDKRGTVCIWPLPGAVAGKRLERLAIRQEPIVCMASTPSPRPSLAVSYGSGTVVIVDMDQSMVIATFAYTAAVKSASWVPGSSSIVVAGQDQSVSIWSISSGADAQAACSEQIMHPVRRSDLTDGKSWISVHALSEGDIAFSGPRGELSRWNASKRKAQHGPSIHNRPIFAIRPVGETHLVTASMDRLVVLWGLEKGGLQLKWRLSGLGGHVTALRTDANVLLVGSGDGNIRVMDLLHSEHRQHCWVVWRGVTSPCTSLASTPQTQGLWACGLQDGSIGVLQVDPADGPGPVDIVVSRGHTGPVVGLCWMTACEQKKELLQQQVVSADGAKPTGGPMAANQEQPTGKGEDEATIHSEITVGAGEASSSSKGKKAKGKGKGKKDTTLPAKLQVRVASNLVLVSLSSGHEALVTRFGAPTQDGMPSSKPLTLAEVGGCAPRPLAVCSTISAGRHVLVIIAASRPNENALEVATLHTYELDMSEPTCLKQTQCLALEGLEASTTVSCIGVQASISEEHPLQVAIGSAKGHLAMVSVAASSVAPTGRPVVATCEAKQAHKKSISEVQWQSPGPKQDDSSAGTASMLLSASLDGCVRIWQVTTSSGGHDMMCTHRWGGPVKDQLGSPLLAACWDLSGGKDSPSTVLAGGREQMVLRWLLSQDEEQLPSMEELHAQGGEGSGKPGSHMPHPVAVRSVVPSNTVQQSSQSKGGPKPARTKPAASLLTLTTAAIYQQPLKLKVMELVRLCGASLSELWPAECQSVSQVNGSACSVTLAALTNTRALADWLVETEIASKLRVQHDDISRPPDLHRARLLRLWVADIQEALALSAQDSSEPGDGMAATASGAWVWAALGASIDRGSWQAEMTKMASSANRGGVAGVESVHHAVAAALAIDMFEDAISLYEEADHLLDALLLARLRLPSGHPMVSHLYGRWADELRRKGNPEMAAACLLAIGKLGPAFADLQECSRPLDGSHTASSFAGAFAVAAVAASMASAQLQDIVTSDDDLSPILAYDHRYWWGSAELKKAVEAWKRLLIEAFSLGRVQATLSLARVDIKTRDLQPGEQFLRSVLSGYASAFAWWDCLHSRWESSDAPLSAEGDDADDGDSEDGGTSTPLHAFVQRYKDIVADHGDWDYEWRVLTWLPMFDAQESVLLTAAVEFGRGCASLASGATRFASGADAPWDHVTKAFDALTSLSDSSSESMVSSVLSKMAILTEREVGSDSQSSLDSCDSFEQESSPSS